MGLLVKSKQILLFGFPGQNSQYLSTDDHANGSLYCHNHLLVYRKQPFTYIYIFMSIAIHFQIHIISAAIGDCY